MTTTDRQRILILGGGFAGLTVAAELERRLADRPDLEICLVNRTNYQLFTPMLSEVAGGGIEPSHIVNPIRAYLHRTNFREGNVTAIDLEKRLVQTEHPESHAPSELTYDRLILGLGSVTNYRNLPGVAEHCFALKTMADAQAVRDHILSLLEQASLIDEPAERSCLLTIVIAGGGFSGAELCGALEDFLSRALRFYPGLSRDEIRLVLVHPGPRLLPEVGEELADYARRDLVRRGIDVRLDARVESATSHDVSLAGGETIPTHTVVWTAGTSPSPVLQSLACDLDSRGAVVVNSFLEVPEWPGVYALGDCARVPDPRTNMPYPPTAQHAIREAETVARNVAASYSIGKRSAFVFDSIGSLAVLGHRTAVAEVKGRRFSGFLAWWMWRTVYWSKLPGLDRKIRVAVDWTLDLAFPADIVQLGSGRQHQDELDEAGLDHRDQSVPELSAPALLAGRLD